MSFIAGHLRRSVGSDDIILVKGGVFQVNGRNAKMLHDAYKDTMATLKRIRKQIQSKRTSFIYRRSDRAIEENVDEQQVLQAGMRFLLETSVGSSGSEFMSCITTTEGEELTELNDDNNLGDNSIGERFRGSWNVRIYNSRDKMMQLMDQVRDGPVTLEGVTITKMFRARKVNVGHFLPEKSSDMNTARFRQMFSATIVVFLIITAFVLSILVANATMMLSP
jgi:hypothetical protein